MITVKEEYIVFECPHCLNLILVYKNDFFCGVFIHAQFKHNHQQVNPHLSKSDCEHLFNNNLIYGCSKPFKIVFNNDLYDVVKCGYI